MAYAHLEGRRRTLATVDETKLIVVRICRVHPTIQTKRPDIALVFDAPESGKSKRGLIPKVAERPSCDLLAVVRYYQNARWMFPVRLQSGEVYVTPALSKEERTASKNKTCETNGQRSVSAVLTNKHRRAVYKSQREDFDPGKVRVSGSSMTRFPAAIRANKVVLGRVTTGTPKPP